MSKQDKIETISINGDEYIKASDIKAQEPAELDGLKYAVVRSREQGVMSGYIVSINKRHVIIKKARQLWRWYSKFTLVELAEYGVNNASECKFSCEASQEVEMLEACGVIYCTKKACNSIRGIKGEKND